VSRLLAGSMGALGLITEVSHKVLPRPVREATLRMAVDEIGALRRLNEWAGQPLPLSAGCWHEGMLTVRLSGAEAAVVAAMARLSSGADGTDTEVMPEGEAAAWWNSLRDQTHPCFAAPSLWRLAVPPHASAIVLKGASLIEWGGAQRWLHADAARAADIRRAVQASGGHATLFRSDDKSVDIFHPQPAALAQLNRRVKQAFDPAGIFNPGRLWQE
jgi:glycolate oxidase FAD binding subunit